MSPTALTLRRLRALGYLADVCERFVPHAGERGQGIKRDLFGVGDVIGVHARDRQVLLVQCTSAAHVGDRLKRVQARPETALLLRAGVAVQVWGWRKIGRRWRVKVVAVDPCDLTGVILEAPRRRRGGR